MKTMYIREGVNMTVDTDTNEIGSIPSAREAIQRIYVSPEPMHVVYQSGKYKQEADVEKNDIIVTFYTDEFDKRMIVLKSEEWVNLLDNYEKNLQEKKEKWAAENNKRCDCDECPCENCKG